MSIRNRVFGLDFLRTTAIFLVLLEHGKTIYKVSFFTFPDGVDLFFVLSGFLVGNIFINTIIINNNFNLSNLFSFLVRRWFRTLPNYFLFLILNIVLINLGLIKGIINNYLITYFVFLQNFIIPFDFLFWESWSLSVEEWFYFLVPLFIFILFKFKRTLISSKYIIIITLIIFITTPLIYRIYSYDANLSFDLFYRKLVITRLDTISFGVLGAFLYNYYHHFWVKRKNLYFFIGLFIIIVISNLNYSNYDFYLKTYHYSLVGFSLLLILPKFSCLEKESNKFNFFKFISKISYSIYLSHLLIFQLIIKYLKYDNFYQTLISYFIFLVITILFSFLIFKYFENPLTNLRDKFVKQHK